ncbi:MAG TPA: MFS transporter [Pseudonocardiaceae bacterium]|jgi:MFS family permease|nr:MFS transporter [Pseudonocardiaceae bacterium]
MFASLRVRNYRLFATGQIVSLVGTWGQRVAQDWLVLELSGGSPVALGIAVALQFTPTLLLSLWAGVLADRYDKRRLLLAVQVAMGCAALLLGLLDVAGVVQLWQVYLLCLLLGCFSAVDVPVRQAFVVEMVGREQVINAVALNSMTFNLARIIGPAVAGYAIVAIGTGWVFLVNAASFAGVVIGLALMDSARLHRAPPLPRGAGQLREGLGYVRRRRDLVVLLALVFFVATFGLNFHTMLPVVARNVFGRGAEAYGLLSTLLAVGTLAGATLAARRSGRGRPGPRLVLSAALAFGLLEVAVGLMPSFLAFGLMLVPCGAAVLTFTTAANSTVQLAVDPSMRGRVMGLYMLLFLGGNPIGAPLMGWLAEAVNGRAPVVFGGLVTIVAAVVCGLTLAPRASGGNCGEVDRGTG